MAWVWFVLFAVVIIGWIITVGDYENQKEASTKVIANLQEQVRHRESQLAAASSMLATLQWRLKNEMEQRSIFETVYRRDAAAKATALDAELLRKVISLCHPDRHGGSRTATEVTQQLLKMRG